MVKIRIGLFGTLIGVMLLTGGLAGAQTVKIALSGEATTLNPADTNGNLDYSIEQPIYQGLVGFNKDFKLAPELATSWTSNAQATQFTFQLRKGVTFQDGTPFNAEAVKTYFDWAKNPANQFKRSSLYSVIGKIEVLGPYEVRFVLSKPFGAMMYNFAHPAGRIVSPAAIKKYGKNVYKHPAGTGPYKFVSWTAQAITLKAWSGYWGPKPKVGELKFLFVPSAATRVAMLQSGDADFIEDVPPQLVKVLKANSGLEVAAKPSIYVQWMSMNTQRAPFDKLGVRQALNYAVNKAEVIKVAYDNYAVPPTAPIAEGVAGYAPQKPYAYDPAKAKELLKKAGYPNGFSFTAYTLSGSRYQVLGQALEQMFAKVGVQMKLEQLAGASFSNTVFKPLDKTTVQAVMVGWSPSTGDADWGLRPLFAKSSWPPALFNLAFFDNSKVDGYLQDALTTATQSLRDRFYAQAEKIIWNQAPWVFLGSPYNISGQTKKLSGVYYMPDGTVASRSAALR